MKTKLLLMIATVGILSFSSCKKDYECECTWPTNPGYYDSDVYTYSNVTKGDAEDACDENVEQLTSLYGSGVSCELR